MRKKSFFTMLSVVLLFSLVLVACNDDTANEGKQEDGTITLNMYTWINEENGNWEEVVAAYEKDNPGVKIKVNALVENMAAADYRKKLDLEAAGGTKIDLMMFSNAEHLAKRIPAGMIEPINEFIDKEGINVEEMYKMGPAPASNEGIYYGLPMKHNTYLIMMNKDHLDAAGLPVPTDWTWDEYKEYSKKLTTNDHHGTYLHTWATLFDTLMLFNKPSEHLLVKADGSSNMADPLVRSSLQLRYDLESVDKSSEPYANIISQKLNYRQQFFTQKASMVPITSYMITEWGGFTPDFNIAWAPWPRNNADDPQYRFTSADIIALGKNSDHKEEAYKFMRWMSTEGMLVQSKSIPAWKEVNVTEVLTNLAESTTNPEAIDIDSLAYVLEYGEEADQFLPAGHTTEVYNAFKVEVDKYLLGEQDLDTTMSRATEAVQKVVDRNQ